MVWVNLNYLISLALSFLLLMVFLVALYLSVWFTHRDLEICTENKISLWTSLHGITVIL